MIDVLPAVVDVLDEPFADASILPTYVLSRFTRESVTVALGGDGSDELLAGYPTFPAERVARLYAVPRLVHERVVTPLVDRLPVSTADFSLRLQAQALPPRGGRAGGRPPRDVARLVHAATSSARCSTADPPTRSPSSGASFADGTRRRVGSSG